MHLPPCREPSGRLNHPGSSVSPLSARDRDKDRILYGLSILLMAASMAGAKEKPCRIFRAILLLIAKRSGVDCTASSETGRISTSNTFASPGTAGTINNAAEAAEISKPMC